MKRLVLASLFVLIAGSIVSQAGITEAGAGYDLFETEEAVLELGGSGPIPFEGVPLETFDFGGTVGVLDTGNADTIVQRIDPATVPSDGQTDTINIEIVALQLVSVDPIDIGGGMGHHFATLQTGVPSTGTMDITFDNQDGGTFDSLFDVFFDLRFGALDGPILYSGSKTFSAADVIWGREPLDLAAIMLDGINYLLDGLTIGADFWAPTALHNADDGSVHRACP